MINKKKMVVEQALSLFVEKGITKTSIQDILTRSGISKGTFYNYFSSKTECIEAILEQARYDATLMRSELMLGKDAQDTDVFINQISVLSNINRTRGLDVVFEELLHSGILELKKLVLKHRIIEFEWFSNRLIELFGEDIRDVAFEAAIMYYGMHQHLSFVSKLISQNAFSTTNISKSTLHYIKSIIHSLVNENTAVLDQHKLSIFRESFNNQNDAYTLEVVQEKLNDFAQASFTNSQKHIVQAVQQELLVKDIRFIVINALLQAFTNEFANTEFEIDAKEISSLIWYFTRQQNK